MKLPAMKMGAKGGGLGGLPKLGAMGPKLAGTPGMPKPPAVGNVRPHLSGVSSHRLSLRGRSAFPPTPAAAFNTPGQAAGPAAAFAGGAGPAGAAAGDMGE